MNDSEDFSAAPVSIAEIRSDKTGCCADWGPRDAIIELLRRMDRGETDVEAVVIVYTERTEERGATKTHFNSACPNSLYGMGMLSRALYQINSAG